MIPPIARRFVAGETPETALEHTKDINSQGIVGILNLLGEHYHDRQPAKDDLNAYLDLIETIDDENVDACISVKPSQLGLEISEDFFSDNLYRIVEHGDEHGVFVWIDMEDSDTTDATLDGFESVTREFNGGVGVCVQANLKRTKNDLERLADLPGKVRLVKGAYDEPADIAYQDKSQVNEAFKENLEFMFQEFDDGVAVGSHDSTMIDRAKQLHREHGTPFEIQMLMGVREGAQVSLADEYDVYQYIPYGSKWLSYFYRRVIERKENLTFALRAILNR